MGKTYKDFQKADMKRKRFMKNKMDGEFQEYLEY